MSSAGTRQSVKMITAVSEARMPSLCSSRSTFMPGLSLRDHERLDRRATQALVEGRPDDHAVGALPRGDVDLLAVDDVLVAVLARGRLDVRGVRAGAGLGDRHRRPGAGEALELLVVGDRGDGGVAETLARHREQQADVAPAHLHDGEHRREVGAVLVALSSSSGFSSRRTPAAPAPPEAPDSEMPSIIAASMSSSLGYSCSASSYLREIGRSMFIATWCAWSMSGRTFLGVSRLIMWVLLGRRGLDGRPTSVRRGLLLPSGRSPAGRGTTAPRGAP